MNRIRKASKRLILALLVICSLWMTVTITQLYRHARQPVDAILVLGGSIRREIHVAESVAQSVAEAVSGAVAESITEQMATRSVEENQSQNQAQNQAQNQGTASPEWHSIPILVSKGSKPPCIRILFERALASVHEGINGDSGNEAAINAVSILDDVWLEDCAKSTFDNFRYSLPILRSWQAHHIKVVTSPTHLPRAQWLAQIMLGSHGIWVEMELVEEKGVPGNVETPLKTGLDVTRSLLWAMISHVYHPTCNAVIPLTSVDLEQWEQKGFKCEHQAGIN